MIGTKIETLDDLMKALDEAGVLSYSNCGTYFKATFKKVGTWNDLAAADKIKLYLDANDTAPKAEVIAGTCGSFTDVYLSEYRYGDDDAPF
jgi:hypothetical protein